MENSSCKLYLNKVQKLHQLIKLHTWSASFYIHWTHQLKTTLCHKNKLPKCNTQLLHNECLSAFTFKQKKNKKNIRRHLIISQAKNIEIATFLRNYSFVQPSYSNITSLHFGWIICRRDGAWICNLVRYLVNKALSTFAVDHYIHYSCLLYGTICLSSCNKKCDITNISILFNSNWTH